jgi:hypothetical protein
MASNPSAAERAGCAPQAALLGVGLLLGPWAIILLSVTAWDFDYIVRTARSLQTALVLGAFAVVALFVGAGAVGVIGAYTRWASPKARKAATKIAIARSQWPELPEGLHSFTFPPAPRAVEPARLVEPPPQMIDIVPSAAARAALPQARPGRSMLQQLDEAGLVNRSGHQLLVGEENGRPVYIDSRKAGVVAIGGAPGTGKSSTVMNLLAQAALMQWGIVVCDPYPEKPDGVLKRCASLGRSVLKRASSPAEIDAAIRWVDGIGRRRLNGEPWRSPLILVIEEFSNLVIRRELPQETVNLLPAMGMAYRSAGIIIIPIGHIWKASLLGGQQMGAVLRQVATYTIVHRLAPDAAELLLPIGSEVNSATLPDGVALVTGPDGIYRVTVPWVSLDDLAYAAAAVAAQAAPAQSWTPPPPPPIQIAPTEPIAPAAPAAPAAPQRPPTPLTVQLDPTLADQIVDLLALSPSGLSAEQIADRTGAPVGTVRNRLGYLRAENIIGYRRVGKGFVYSISRRPLVA